MTNPDDRYGKPFDLLILAGPQTESGRSLHDISDVAPIMAEAVLVLANTPLRDSAAGLANNVFRRLEEVTEQGEPTAWGSLGIVTWVISGKEVAEYFAHSCAATLLDRWQSEAPEAEVEARLKSMGHATHMGDVDELMRLVQSVEGRPRLADYGKEVARSLKTAKVKTKLLPDKLRAFEETFEIRMHGAVREAVQAAKDATREYVGAAGREARIVVDERGPVAGDALIAGALTHIGAMQATLDGQRESLRDPLSQTESETGSAFQALEAAISRPRFGFLRRFRKPLAGYVSAATKAFRLRYAYDLTEGVLAVLAGAQRDLHALHLQLQTMVDNFKLVGERCSRWTEAFESQEVTPVTEIVRRSLCSTDQLRRLYRQTYGGDWGTVPPEMDASVRQAVGRLSRWIDRDKVEIFDELNGALAPLFEPTARMTADDFLRWLSETGDSSPEFFMRDSAALAPALCRYDRARLPDAGAFEDTAFRIVGVPDRESSTLAGVGDVVLVSTGDADRIVYLSLKLGIAASTLWHHERYLSAAEEVRRRGRVAQRIYSGFPYPSLDPQQDGHSQNGRRAVRRGGSLDKKGRRQAHER